MPEAVLLYYFYDNEFEQFIFFKIPASLSPTLNLSIVLLNGTTKRRIQI